MACVINYKNKTYSLEDFKNVLLQEPSLVKEVANKSQERLKGIQEVFNSNPELSKIGDAFSYAIYLDTIFPNSKVKDIVNVTSVESTRKEDKKNIFNNSLWRGQATKPIIDKNGNLVLKPSYEELSKDYGKSFSTSINTASDYGHRYSQNPFFIEVDEDYINKNFKLFNEDVEGEKRIISKNNIIIPKGKYNIVSPKLKNITEDIDTLIERYIYSLGFMNSADELNLSEVGRNYESNESLLDEILNRLDTNYKGLLYYIQTKNIEYYNKNYNDVIEHGLNDEEVFYFKDNPATNIVNVAMNTDFNNYTTKLNLDEPQITTQHKALVNPTFEDIGNLYIDYDPFITSEEEVNKENINIYSKGLIKANSLKPEQIHILSSKKDLEMFKNFINFTKSDYAKYGDIQQFKDYIMSRNFAAIEEFLVVNNKIDRKC